MLLQHAIKRICATITRCRRLAAIILLTPLMLGASLIGASSAAADSPWDCTGKRLIWHSSESMVVPSRSEWTIPYVSGVPAGAKVTVTARGSMWAGVIFTGENGPDGWVGWSADGGYPAPGANLYSLIGKFGPDTRNNDAVPIARDDANPWRFIGEQTLCMQAPTNRSSDFFLGVNDWRHNDNTGGFPADIAVYA